jgi:uncharacterized membrane protein
MDRTVTDRAVVAGIDAGVNWFVDKWLALFNALMAVYVALPLLAPVLMAIGQRESASVIYWLYSYACHQLPSHSWFPFGYQMAYCQRDTGIYLSMLIGGLLYARARFWTRGLPFWTYVLLSLPIAIDGGSALFGWRESTPLLRTITGVSFGLATAWFVYPLMDRALMQFGELPAQRRLEAA